MITAIKQLINLQEVQYEYELLENPYYQVLRFMSVSIKDYKDTPSYFFAGSGNSRTNPGFIYVFKKRM